MTRAKTQDKGKTASQNGRPRFHGGTWFVKRRAANAFVTFVFFVVCAFSFPHKAGGPSPPYRCRPF